MPNLPLVPKHGLGALSPLSNSVLTSPVAKHVDDLQVESKRHPVYAQGRSGTADQPFPWRAPVAFANRSVS